MKNTLRTPPVFPHAARVLLALVILQFPVIGYCDSGSGWFKNLFESKGKNMKEVAVKVAELPEQYKMNVRGLDFSPDGKHLAVVSGDEKINIWDWQSGHIVHTVEKMQGASDGLTSEPIRYSPDGRLFASCHDRSGSPGLSGDVVIRIWNTETWAVVHDIVDLNFGSCRSIGFTPDGKYLIGVLFRIGTHPGGNLIIYDTTSWQPLWDLRTVPFYPTALSISPDGKFVAIGGVYDNKGGMTQQIALVDLAQRAIIRTIPNTVEFDNSGHLAWSPDGAHITAIGRRGWDAFKGVYTSGLDTTMVFDAQTGKQIAGEQLDGIAHASLRYTPDEKYLIEGDMDALGNGLGVRIWDGQHRELLQKISGNVGGLAVSRDGHYFAMGIDEKTIVWQLK